MREWFVYVLLCADGTFYTGITLDLRRRIDEHNAGAPKGAKYTRGRLPVVLYHVEVVQGRSQASIREAQIKKMNTFSKRRLSSYYEKLIYENLTRERS
jgi:putative endonuclease